MRKIVRASARSSAPAQWSPDVSAPVLTGSGGGRTTDLDGGAHIVYNITPESGQGADLRACEVSTSTAVTVTEHAKQTDRGIRVVTRPCVSGDVTHTLKADGFDGSEDGTGRGMPIVPETKTAVRRLTPTECERLQGFPDGWTIVPPLPRAKKAK